MSRLRGRVLAFGSGGITGDRSPAEIVDLAQRADELGFDLFSLSDHLHSTRPTVEPWTALSWVAARTRRIEVATNVLGLPYRHPAVLAKAAESLDRLSGGRVVVGLGAGGYDHEFAAFGLDVRGAGAKITAQDEAITLLRDLWTGEPTTLDGAEFRVREARIDPPAEHPVPIWLGSYGPRALALTGRRADGWLPSLGRLTLAEASARREVVRAAAVAAGRDPDDVTCACNIAIRVQPGATPAPGTLAGTVDEVVAQTLEVVAAGFTVLLVHSLSKAEQVVLAEEVFPAVRAAAVERGLAVLPSP